MRVNLVRGGRYAFCALSAVAVAVVLPQSVAVPAGKEATQVPFVERYRALQHGGIVRAANSSITCRRPRSSGRRSSCPAAREGGAAANDDNGDFEMFYIDVDNDPNTYNSSRAELRLPAGARVTYARLYWGGNLRAGEQKPPKDNGRVLIAEPGGAVQGGARRHRRSGTGSRTAPTPSRPPPTSPGSCACSGAGAYTVGADQRGDGPLGGRGLGRLDAGRRVRERARSRCAHLALWDGFETAARAAASRR